MEKNLSFEEAMQKLNLIVAKMERGEVSLEESLNLFQEGTELARLCGKKLEDAKLQVKKVLENDLGEPVVEDFTDETAV